MLPARRLTCIYSNMTVVNSCHVAYPRKNQEGELILGLTVPSTQQRAQRYPQEQEWPAFQQSFSRDIACYRLDNKAKGYKDGDKVRSEDPVRYQLVECHGEWLFVESLVRIKDRCAERPVIAQVEGD
jgi:hypothetical protein